METDGSVWKRLEPIPIAYGALGFQGLCLSLKQNPIKICFCSGYEQVSVHAKTDAI